MMTSEQGSSMPEPGEIVVCTVREITSHGIYVNLDQYGGMNGFLHVSEISTGWVRHIERGAKPKQRLVLHVIRAGRTRKQVGLALSQVTKGGRSAKDGISAIVENSASATDGNEQVKKTQATTASSAGSAETKVTSTG